MKSTTRLDSAVFQLTPTRTRCDLYIIANDKKEKIASGLLNPFIAHLKAAQDQIAQGGYSVLLAPEAGSNATWFTKCTVESFVRFVSTPEILERVYTIESEILQIEEAVAIQGNNDILIEDQQVMPVASSKGNKPAYDADEEEKAIVLYKPGAHELTSSSAKERNSKLQLINVLETRKTVLKKEQGMAFARAVAAGFEIEHLANLLSFAECFGASRLMSACLRFMDLWKQKHESGQWLEIEAEDDKSDYSASGIVLSSMIDRHDAISETTKEAAGNDPNAVAGGQQQYHTGQYPHPGFPPWGMHSSPPGGVPLPVYSAYPMPYYQHYAGFYHPPPPYPSSSSMDNNNNNNSNNNNNRYTNPESEGVNEESSEQHKNAGKSSEGRVVIRNINSVNSKRQNSSDIDTSDETTHPKRKGNRKESESETLLNGKETDSGHWDAFQSYLLEGAAAAAAAEEEDMFAMEKDPKTKRRLKSMADDDDGKGHMQSYDTSGRKMVYRGRNDDFMIGGSEEANVRNPLDDIGIEGATANLDKRSGLQGYDEAVMVSLCSGVNNNDYNITSGGMMNMFENKSNKPRAHDVVDVKYEPDALSLMPERDVEKRLIGYDPALDYEMQLVEKKSKLDKKGSSSAEKQQHSKAKQGVIRKGRPSKVNNNNNNNSTLEDARARADKLRSYKADLQKMKKEQQEAEQRRLEALKMERQKRIAARTSRKQLPSKHSPISHTGGGSAKFTDSDPTGSSSSPLQRSKIRPTSISSSKLMDRKHSAAAAGNNRLTRSLSSMSETKKDFTSVTDSNKASMTRIKRRLSEHKNTPHTSKTRSADPVSKPKSSSETKGNSAAIVQKSQKVKAKPPQVAKLNLNNRLNDADDNPIIIDKTVVMLEHNKQQTSLTTKEFDSDHITEFNNIHEVPLPMETVDKGTISVHPQKHPTTTSSCEVCVDEELAVAVGEKNYQAPVEDHPSSRNVKAPPPPQSNFNLVGNGTEKTYISDFNNLKLEKIPQLLDKPQPKGFRRLLKLGKKTHTHTHTTTPPDNASPVSAQVQTLKTLISEDQTPTHGQKSSRHFSILSSFRGKTAATTFGS